MTHTIDELKKQIQEVIRLTLRKKHETGDSFLDTLLKKLKKAYKELDENVKPTISQNPMNLSPIDGAIRAYYDSGLVKRDDEPIIVELDKLESMLRNHYASMTQSGN
ncbi:hypothetical protein NSQ26_04515 [Bacillus sp. FSL W7-1360]